MAFSIPNHIVGIKAIKHSFSKAGVTLVAPVFDAVMTLVAADLSHKAIASSFFAFVKCVIDKLGQFRVKPYCFSQHKL
jgi:hypothetical protein